MARVFTPANTTESISWGSPAKLDNLAQGTFTCLAVGRRTSGAPNLWVAGKSSSIITNGWQFFLDQYNTGANDPGHLRVIVGTDGAYYSIYGGNASGVDTVVANQHEMFGFTWSGTAPTFYRGPLDMPVQQNATANTVENAGSGTVGDDSSANMESWHSPVSATPFGGDGAWTLIYTGQLTLAQIHQVQQGVLTCTAGDFTRGVAMMTAISGAVLLGHVAADGTCTDYSASPATGTLTGTSAGTELANVFAPTAFEDDLEPLVTTDIREQTTYRYTSSYAQRRYTTTATTVKVWMNRTLEDTAEYDPVAAIGVLVNGAYTDTLLVPGLGIGADQTTGLSASSKVVTIVNGPRSRPSTLPAQGTFMTVVIFNAAATQETVATRSSPLRTVNDSINEGFFADPPAQNGTMSRLRLALPDGYDGIQMHSYGGMRLNHIANATDLANTVAILTNGDPAAILIELGVNDKANNIALATFQGQLEDLITDCLAGFTGKIFVADMVVSGINEGANGNGATLDDFRAAVASAVTAVGSARVTLLSMETVLTLGDLGPDDSHPSTAGHGVLAAFYDTELALSGTVSGVVRLGGSPVSGAVVRLIRQSDNYTVQTTTNGSGVYSFTVGLGQVYHAVVEYTTGGNKYTARSVFDLVPAE